MPSGCATGTAPSPAAELRPRGPTPTTSSTGPTGARPTWLTRRCSAAATTRSSTATGLRPTSPGAAWSGTADRVATTASWRETDAPGNPRGTDSGAPPGRAEKWPGSRARPASLRWRGSGDLELDSGGLIALCGDLV